MAKGMFCTQCEAGRLPPHHLFPRPARRCWRSTRRASKRTRSAYPVLLSNGNPIARGRSRRRAALRGRGTIRSPSPAISSRWWRAIWACIARQFHHHVGPQGRARYLSSSTATSRKATYAMDSLKRAMKWDEEKYGREYDLDIFMIVAVSAFNMGAMENKGLNIFNDKVLLASPRNRHRRRLCAHRKRGGPRIFPQLDRRPHHLPRLVPAVAEGRPDRLPRPELLRRHALAMACKRIEDVRALRVRQFQEDAGPLAHPVQPQSYIAIDNFYTATVYEKGAEVIGMLKTLVGRRRLSQGHRSLFRAP